MVDVLPVAIIGGGLGGAALANFLQLAGIPCAVFERDRLITPRNEGFFSLQLDKNTVPTILAQKRKDKIGTLRGTDNMDLFDRLFCIWHLRGANPYQSLRARLGPERVRLSAWPAHLVLSRSGG